MLSAERGVNIGDPRRPYRRFAIVFDGAKAPVLNYSHPRSQTDVRLARHGPGYTTPTPQRPSTLAFFRHLISELGPRHRWPAFHGIVNQGHGLIDCEFDDNNIHDPINRDARPANRDPRGQIIEF